jgi:hypothetical protein
MTTPTRPTRERWLGPGVAGIGTASFLADVGHEIPTALLPNLLTATLGAPPPPSDSSKASPTAWPAPLGWPVAPWPTTPAAAALWPLPEVSPWPEQRTTTDDYRPVGPGRRRAVTTGACPVVEPGGRDISGSRRASFRWRPGIGV